MGYEATVSQPPSFASATVASIHVTAATPWHLPWHVPRVTRMCAALSHHSDVLQAVEAKVLAFHKMSTVACKPRLQRCVG